MPEPLTTPTSETDLTADSGIAHNTQALREHIQRLIVRGHELLDRGGRATDHAVNDLGARLEVALDKLADSYAAARIRVAEGAQKTDVAIRHYPYQSLAIVFGVGVVVGALARGGGGRSSSSHLD